MERFVEELALLKKELTENSVKVGGWGQHRTNFPFFLFEKKQGLKILEIALKHFKTKYFFSNFGGVDPPQLGSPSIRDLNFQTLWKSHLASVR